MTRLDDMESRAIESSAAETGVGKPGAVEAAREVHPVRIALQALTIGDLANFLFKLTIAAIVAAFPFAIIGVII